MPGVPHWISGHTEGGHSSKKPNNVPPKQDPKSRPPRSLRDKVPFQGTLPRYTGPYSVSLPRPARRECKLNEMNRSASWTSRSLHLIPVPSHTSRDITDTYCSWKRSLWRYTTPRRLVQGQAKILEDMTIGQEKSGFHIHDQSCRKAMERLQECRRGSLSAGFS